MKVGLISDSHGNLGDLLEVFDWLRGEQAIAKLFFLGHHYQDIERLIEVKEALRKTRRRRAGDDDEATEDGALLSGALLADALARQAGTVSRPAAPRDQLEDPEWLRRHCVRVPAADDPESLLGDVQNAEFELVAGRFLCAVHNPKRLGKEDIASASMVLYGHTHLYQVDRVGGRYFINPGHLMEGEDQGRPPTFGLLDLGETPCFRVYDLEFNVLLEEPLDIEAKRKFSVS